MGCTNSMSDCETKNTMENAQEDSVEYNKFYSEFTPRALYTIWNIFDFFQACVDHHGVNDQMENIRNSTQCIDMLQKIFTLVQQIEEKDKRKKKND